MSCFFIDLENVRSYGLEGILLLKPEDKVYVFYSDNANTLTIPTIESLNESSAQVKYIKTNYIGANAMDFQIVTLLGASIEKEKTGKFYIISHDNGFKSAVKFCEGYFTGYDIVTGVFANILLAINSEKNVKKEQLNKPEEVSQTTEGAVKEKSRRNRRNRGRKDTGESQKAVEQKEVSTENEKLPVIEETTEKTDESVKKEPGKNRSRNHRRKKTFTNQEEKSEEVSDPKAADKGADKAMDKAAGKTADKAEDTAAEKTVDKASKTVKQEKKRRGRDNSGNYRYVYNALSDYLSKTTIDLYASKIDEGIRTSSNKNELHQFFKKNYGADEAEALYKIIHSDFDKLKKEAGK